MIARRENGRDRDPEGSSPGLFTASLVRIYSARLSRAASLFQVGAGNIDQLDCSIATLARAQIGVGDMQKDVILDYLGDQAVDRTPHCGNHLQRFGTALLLIQHLLNALHLTADTADAIDQLGLRARCATCSLFLIRTPVRILLEKFFRQQRLVGDAVRRTRRCFTPARGKQIADVVALAPCAIDVQRASLLTRKVLCALAKQRAQSLRTHLFEASRALQNMPCGLARGIFWPIQGAEFFGLPTSCSVSQCSTAFPSAFIL